MYCNPGSIIKDMQLRMCHFTFLLHVTAIPHRFCEKVVNYRGFGREAGLHKHITKQPGLSLQDGASRKIAELLCDCYFYENNGHAVYVEAIGYPSRLFGFFGEIIQ